MVIESDDALIAIGMLVAESDKGRIVRMSVAPDRRRLGLGRLVVDELLTWARVREMSEVVVLTDTAWHSAVALYRACGFVELAVDDVDTHFSLAL